MYALVVENLEKKLGGKPVLKGLNFSVKEGEIFGLIGPNGAGKTTTLRIISTILKKDSGKVEVFGVDVSRDPEFIKRIISYLPEEAGVYRNMKGIEYLEFMASFYTDDKKKLREIVEYGLEISGLGEKLKDKVSTYSKGMVRKLVLARALMTRPKLALLDEPTSGLDVLNSMEIRNLLKEIAKAGTTILVSSHNMLEVEYLCDRVAFIYDGRILKVGRSDELKSEYGANNLEEVFSEVVNVVFETSQKRT